MKIDKRIQSSKSIYLLEQKIKSFFKQGDVDPVVFCNNCDILWPNSDTYDVVFLGSALLDILQIDFFPRKAFFRFWVLNESLRTRLINIVKLPSSSIGVINRYDLFEKSGKLFFPEINSAGFVYSARANSLKNFNLVVMFLEKLGKAQKRKINLEVYSPSISDQNFLNASHWVNVVRRGDQGIEWVQSVDNIKNKYLINFSIDPLDDFNVSTAQWQSAGGAVVAPYMGPYLELEGENVYYIDPKILIESYKQNKVLFNEGHFKVYNPDGKERITYDPSPVLSKEFFGIINEVDSHIRNVSKNLNSSDLTDFTERILLNDSL